MEHLIAHIIEKNKKKVVIPYSSVVKLLKKQRLAGAHFRTQYVAPLQAVGIDCEIVKDMVVFTVNDSFFHSI